MPACWQGCLQASYCSNMLRGWAQEDLPPLYASKHSVWHTGSLICERRCLQEAALLAGSCCYVHKCCLNHCTAVYVPQNPQKSRTYAVLCTTALLAAPHLLICWRPVPACRLRCDQQLIALDGLATSLIRHIPFQLQQQQHQRQHRVSTAARALNSHCGAAVAGCVRSTAQHAEQPYARECMNEVAMFTFNS